MGPGALFCSLLVNRNMSLIGLSTGWNLDRVVARSCRCRTRRAGSFLLAAEVDSVVAAPRSQRPSGDRDAPGVDRRDRSDKEITIAGMAADSGSPGDARLGCQASTALLQAGRR